MNATRLPGTDESSRRFGVEKERRVEEASSSDHVAEMHQVMCESDWPDKLSSCENVSIQVRIAWRSKKV